MYYPSLASNGSSILVPIFIDVTNLSIVTPPVAVPLGSWEILWSIVTDVNPQKAVVYFAPNGIEVGEAPSGFRVLTNEPISKTQWRITVENAATETSILGFNVHYEIGDTIFQHDPTILVVNDPVSPVLVVVSTTLTTPTVGRTKAAGRVTSQTKGTKTSGGRRRL